jgi:hypothetical protein
MLALLDDGPMEGATYEVPDYIPMLRVIVESLIQPGMEEEDAPVAVYRLTWRGTRFVYTFWRMD